MKYEKLENNLIDLMKEQQLKLGFCKECVRFYYPLSSLNHILDTKLDVESMKVCLCDFKEFAKERLGMITLSNDGERFCIKVPEEGGVYVHEHMRQGEFIEQLIKMLAVHKTSIEELRQLFDSQQIPYHWERVSNGEFDYLAYFEEGSDPYYYCFKDEGCHIIYHRYLPEDYRDFRF